MSNMSVTSRIVKKFSSELEAAKGPPSYYHGGAGCLLKNIPDNMIVFFGGGNEYKAPPASLHMRYSLIINLRDTCHCRIDNNTFELGAENGILIFPLQIHCINTIRKVLNHRRLVISFTLPPDEVSLSPLKNHPFRINRREADILCEICSLYHRATRKYRSEIPFLLALFLEAKLNQTEQNFFNASSGGVSIREEHLAKIIDFIHKNYLKPISIKMVAQHVGLGNTQVRNIFREMSNGLTFGKFIYQLRMLKSTEFLMHSDMRINEIATIFGYSDQFAFSRAFRNYFHISPIKYRRERK